jgi:hypothetical protein
MICAALASITANTCLRTGAVQSGVTDIESTTTPIITTSPTQTTIEVASFVPKEAAGCQHG